MEAVRKKSVWRTKRSVSSCTALDRISFLFKALHPTSPPSHKHKLKILTKQNSFFLWSAVQLFARKSEETVSLDGRGGGDGLVPELFLMSSFLSQRAVAVSTLLDGCEGPQQLVMYWQTNGGTPAPSPQPGQSGAGAISTLSLIRPHHGKSAPTFTCTSSRFLFDKLSKPYNTHEAHYCWSLTGVSWHYDWYCCE